MPVDILKELLRIPSVYGEEKEIADFSQNFLESANPKLEVLRTSNTILACTPQVHNANTVALVGHLDTVPGRNDVKEEPGRIYGLGASDMKAGNAVILKLAQDTARLEPRFNLLFILYEKEEGPYQENGLNLVFKHWIDRIKRACLAFILEPTDNVVQPGCLGSVHAWFVFEGKKAHSARPWQGVNAIHKAWRLLKLLDETKPTSVVVDGLTYKEVLSATMVEYSGARNLVPWSFKVNINYRFAPGKSVEDATAFLTELARAVGACRTVFTDISPSALPHLNNEVLQEFMKMFSLKVEPKQAWTDVARFATIGVPAVNFGPGQPHQAHQENEYVEVKKVNHCYRMLKQFLFKNPSPHRLT